VLATPTQLALSKPMVNRRTLDELSILYGNAVLNGVFAGIVIDTYSKSKSAAATSCLRWIGRGRAGIVALSTTLSDSDMALRSPLSRHVHRIREALVWLLCTRRTTLVPTDGGQESAMLTWDGHGGLARGGIAGTFLGTTLGEPRSWDPQLCERRCGGHFGRRNRQEERHRSACGRNCAEPGAIGGALLGAQVSPSVARVRFIDLGGLSGGCWWEAVLAMAGKDARPPGVTAALDRMATGVATAWYFTRHMEEDFPRTGRPKCDGERVPTIAPASNGAGNDFGRRRSAVGVTAIPR